MDLKPNKDYSVQIKRLRDRMGLTQVELAERLGVSFPTVNRWENAKSKPSQLLCYAANYDTKFSENRVTHF